MKLHKLQKAPDHVIREWLVQELNLNDYQKSRMYERESIRFAPFYFYETRQKEKVGPLWRLTLFAVVPYLLICYLGLPFGLLITGHWGYSERFYNFHASWMRKLNLEI